MLTAQQGKEIVLDVADAIGELAKLAKIVSEKGVNMLAMSAATAGGKGDIRLVTDDNLRAGDALKAAGYSVREQDVILLNAEHKPGILRHIADVLARERINVEHLYASAGINQDKCVVVLRTGKNDRAMVLLND